MRRAGICLWMMLKRMGKHPAYWILLLLFPAAIFAVPKFNRAAEEEQILVGYAAEEAEQADSGKGALFRCLQFAMLPGSELKNETKDGGMRENDREQNDIGGIKNSDGTFKYVKYTDKDKMKEDIATGKLSCGVFFDGDFSQRLKEQDYRHCITLYLPEGMNVGGMVQEDLFSRVYQAHSAVWYAELLEDRGCQIGPEEVLWKFSEYQREGKVFAVSYEVCGEGGKPLSTEGNTERGVSVLSLRSVLAFLTLLSASLGALDAGKDRKRNTGKGIQCPGAVCRHTLTMAAAGAPIIPATLFLAGGMLFHTIGMTGRLLQTQILSEIGSALLYGFVLWLLAVFVSRFIPVKLLEGIMPCFLLIVLLCCPVFFDPGETIPLFGYLSKVFPITWYLRFWG